MVRIRTAALVFDIGKALVSRATAVARSTEHCTLAVRIDTDLVVASIGTAGGLKHLIGKLDF